MTCTPDLTLNMNNRWAFCTKMAFAKDQIARVKAQVEFLTEGPHNDKALSLQLFVFKEEAWDQVLRNEGRAEGRVTCEKMGHSASYRDLMYFG